MATSTAIESVGIDKVVNGIIKQEGGTPQGKNNPGNVKFANQPGATKGKTAPDGGNYADFSTPEAGKKSVTDLVQRAANSGKSLSQFVAEYKGETTNKEFDKGAGKTNVTPTAIEPKDIPDGYYQASDGLLYKK